ncbi:SDR family NAD(P)-dependent oxidoreductase [Halobacillus sp. B29]|uniref:SDR family NAD(P)-dependent oxidoreductase n=1 Tax=Halobacillus sp. B29 TaxID=3457432 RepID=UPI003FCDFEAD
MYFKDKKILVIGGTGTIGKCIVKHLLKDHPKYIRVFSRDEYKQQQLQAELDNNKKVQCIIGDVREYDSLFTAMHGVDYVLHLAAMKRVDSCETNPFEAVKTNVQGTNNVINAAIAQGVKKVIFTSSDKAVSPTNTYGATKLIGERLISAAQINHADTPTRFASVRFGNVMGSRGSVIPVFKEGILSDQKITITDKSMTRFMMTLEQATELTIKALKEAQGGEVFVLKMPVIILGELVNMVLEETCKNHNINPEQIEVNVMGARPGEKMYEELMTYDESKSALELPDMYIIPGKIFEKEKYSNAKKASVGSYGSMNRDVIKTIELRKLLKKAGLL